MIKYFILTIILLAVLSTVNASQCRKGWTGYDCSVCTVENENCGCDNSINFGAGKRYSCSSTVPLDALPSGKVVNPGITFVCGSSTCYLNLYSQNDTYLYGWQGPVVQCKLSGCEFNQMNAQCSDIVCDCKNCEPLTYSFTPLIKGKSSISCDKTGICIFNGPSPLSSIIQVNTVNIQCIAGLCNTPQRVVSPSIEECENSKGAASSLLPLISLGVIFSLVSLLI